MIIVIRILKLVHPWIFINIILWIRKRKKKPAEKQFFAIKLNCMKVHKQYLKETTNIFCSLLNTSFIKTVTKLVTQNLLIKFCKHIKWISLYSTCTVIAGNCQCKYHLQTICPLFKSNQNLTDNHNIIFI